jgi:hypothetical protein
MLIDAIEGYSAALEPDYERIATYHRRPLAARYADLLRIVGAKEPARG